MGEPLRGRIDLAIHVTTLDQVRAIRDAAAAYCDAWSDGEDEDTMRRLENRLDRAYRKWAAEVAT